MRVVSKPIKISDRWSLKSDRWNWILIETLITSRGKQKSRETYHRNIQSVSDYIGNESIKEHETLEAMQEAADTFASGAIMTINAIIKARSGQNDAVVVGSD